jgi:hypothetical protein
MIAIFSAFFLMLQVQLHSRQKEAMLPAQVSGSEADYLVQALGKAREVVPTTEVFPTTSSPHNWDRLDKAVGPEVQKTL